jgi:hypothetical protein
VVAGCGDLLNQLSRNTEESDSSDKKRKSQVLDEARIAAKHAYDIPFS